MRTLPPMPGVAVVTPATGGELREEGSAPADVSADDDDEGPDAEYAVPCEEGAFANAGAELALEAFSAKVHALPASADPKPLEEELEKLLEHPCFEIAKADSTERLTFSSGVSLRHWWLHGGSDWLWSYLHAASERSLRIAPTPRVALTLETVPKDHPLLPLLCPADETKPCAIESSGWARRAQEKLALVGDRHRGRKDEVDCAEEAATEPKASRYATYRDCLDGSFARQEALPVGRFKAPSDGWLVLTDENGACRRYRALDLSGGSAYAATDCTGSGSIRTQVGRLPVGALREAAWMLVLAKEAQANVRLTQAFNVPDKMPIKRARSEHISLGSISCGCGTSQRRSWSWMRQKKGALRGQASGVVVGRGGDDAIQHAFDLLAIADAAFEEGCAPSAPPPRIEWSSPGPSSHEGGAAVIDAPASEPVRKALVKAKPARTCTPKP